MKPSSAFLCEWYSYILSRDAVDQLKSDFVQVCLRDQDCFRSEVGWEALLALLPGDRGQ